MDLSDQFTVADAAAVAGLNPDDYRPNRKTTVPWRADAHPSLHVWSNGLGYCDYSRQGEPGWSGNGIAFLAACMGVTYAKAFALASGKAGKEQWESPERRSKAVTEDRRRKRDARPDPLQKHQIALLAAAAKALAESHSNIRNALAKQRGWKPETLRDLCLDGILGYVDFTKWYRPFAPDDGPPWPEAGTVAFLYGWGAKCRWKDAKGERQIRWLWNYGLTKPTLWNGPAREGRMVPLREKNIWITEGETDAITLIDQGVSGRVMALPSASYVIPDWEIQALANRRIILAIDNDRAGRLCRDRVAEQLKPFCDLVYLPLPEGMDVDEARKAGKLNTAL